MKKLLSSPVRVLGLATLSILIYAIIATIECEMYGALVPLILLLIFFLRQWFLVIKEEKGK